MMARVSDVLVSGKRAEGGRRPVLLVTGSSGLIGSEMCTYFAAEGYEVHGLDNNQRAVFFGPAGDTRWNQARLEREVRGFVHHELETRWDYDDEAFVEGVPETFPIDQSTHSLLGASKLAADVMVQEYGPTSACPRAACAGGA
jgi:nucleoside-diphosphate-sugar epimerase